jgi:hypothetical protein
LEGSKNNFGLGLAIQNNFGMVVFIRWESDMTATTATIEARDGIFFLHIPGRECPMGFSTREAALSFAVNNLGLAVR